MLLKYRVDLLSKEVIVKGTITVNCSIKGDFPGETISGVEC